VALHPSTIFRADLKTNIPETDMIDRQAPLTIYLAKKFITMDESLPMATAVGVIGDRIVAVGDEGSMVPWREGRQVTIDDRLRDKVVMPGFIENHVHPFLGAILLPSEIIAPEDWRRPDGGVAPAAKNGPEYRQRLGAWIADRGGKDEWLISWGYQPLTHGPLSRTDLDLLCPDFPLYIQHRSYHEVFVNTKGLEKLGITEESVAKHPQVNWAKGHFFETGKGVAMRKLLPYLLRKEWYNKGLAMLGQLCLQGGITTIGDQLFGGVDPDYELAALDAEIESKKLPLRIVNIMDARSFSNRAAGVSSGPPDAKVDFEKGLLAIEKIFARETAQIKFSKAIKLFADGAMFSQLMQLNSPGYADGHHGEWLMSPEVLAEGIRTFWKADYQIHVPKKSIHVLIIASPLITLAFMRRRKLGAWPRSACWPASIPTTFIPWPIPIPFWGWAVTEHRKLCAPDRWCERGYRCRSIRTIPWPRSSLCSLRGAPPPDKLKAAALWARPSASRLSRRYAVSPLMQPMHLRWIMKSAAWWQARRPTSPFLNPTQARAAWTA
jgi:hypothetical protein